MIEQEFNQFKGGFEDFLEDYVENNIVIELPKKKFKVLQKYKINFDFSHFN